MKVYKFIFPYLKKYKGLIIIFILMYLLIGLINIAIPYMTGLFIDKLIVSPDKSVVVLFGTVFIGVNLLKVVVSFITTMLNSKLTSNIVYNLNKEIIFNIQKLPYTFLKNANIAYLLQRTASDSNNIVSFILSTITNITVNLIILITTLILLFSINTLIALIIIVLTTVYILFYICYKNPLKKYKEQLKEEQSKFQSALFEQIEKTREIKLLNLFNYFHMRLENRFSSLYDITLKQQKKIFMFQGTESILIMVAHLILLVFGGMQIIEGNLSIGLFTILTNYLSQIIGSIQYFSELSRSYLDVKVSLQRIVEIQNMKIEKNGLEVLKSITKINLKSATIQFAGANVFEQLNYEFTPGKIYGIIGENGTGKSTFVNIILGMYQSEMEGSVSYNDILIEAIDLYKTRENCFNLLLQDLLVISEDVKENMGICQNTDMEKLIIHLDNFGLTHLMDEICKQTQRSRFTKDLSGGEKQKLAIIKLLLEKKSVYIFDEPTSSMDENSKIYFIEQLRKISIDSIVLIISHDLDLIQIFDEKIYFKHEN